ncbi:uncharacterized protein [Heterodontus francisci]|uniref:uncharacterized protein n=1 Tax=Heterodontus francisci TaxID=7792 RepID=UPI00355BAB8D
MPGGVGRRVQPFTVGTKLSVPLPARQADLPKMRRSSDDHCPSSSFSFLLCSPSQEALHRAPAGHSSTARSEQREEEEKEERGVEADQTSASRSVRKITISTAREERHGSTVGGQDEAGSTSESNANSNNNSSNSHKAKGRPEIVSVNSRYQMDCQFKVYLGSKDPEAGGDLQQSTTEKCFPHKHEGRPREEEGHSWSISMLSSKDPPPETQATIASTRGHETTDSTTADQDLSVSHMTAQYNRECMQMLAWLKGHLTVMLDLPEIIDWDTLESAQKSHVALECEILANSAGIEVVRSEGRNLIQDCCQPTSQVKEILGELERLWAELRRFHQDKEALLEETEKALKVLGELSDIKDFLQFAEATLLDSTPENNVQMIRTILEELKHLETEMWSSSAKLQTLREKRDLFPRRNYFLLEKIEMKIEAADRRFNSLEIRLERRAADLKNSLAIAELLQDMQQEPVCYPFCNLPPTYSDISYVVPSEQEEAIQPLVPVLPFNEIMADLQSKVDDLTFVYIEINLLQFCPFT